VMLRLRAECPWKSAQTHRSLTRYLLEETAEAIDAIDAGNPVELREELGDLLLQVYFHAVIAAEAGEFTLDDVLAGITEKMVRRNPHVFGDEAAGADALDAHAINEAWEAIKATEKARGSVLEGLGSALSALLYADKVLDRLARAGAEPSSVAVEIADAEDLGGRLLGLVEQAHELGLDPELALRDAVRRRVREREG
jgi:XTP/dITP diphosphohydrolase